MAELISRAKLPSRRTNPKSKSGCRVCKRRKIKCDEQRPSCRNCLRHEVPCDLAQITSSRTGFKNESNSSHLLHPKPSHDSHTIVPNSGYTNGDLNISDLELLHNFSTSTSYTVSANPIMRNLWRITVPKLSLNHPFVMHGLLSMSALHLAHNHSNDSTLQTHYISLAMSHHSSALSVASSIMADPTIMPETATALYLFSATTCYISLASPRKPGDLLFAVNDGEGNEGIAEWLHLFRGTRTIITEFNDILHSGPLGPMFEIGGQRAMVRDSDKSEIEAITELKVMMADMQLNSEERRLSDAVLDELRKSFNAIYRRGPQDHEPSDVFIWIFKIPEGYLTCVKRREPWALVLLAYFAVLLQLLDSNWWMEGWGTYLISRIYSSLDEQNRLRISWPIQEIGWIPG